MFRRPLLLLAVVVCLLLAAPFVVRWAMTPAPGVTLENFKRLHMGMRLDEIERIMGRAADTKLTQPNLFTEYEWQADVVVMVRFEDNGFPDPAAYSGRCVWQDNKRQERMIHLARRPNVFAEIRRWLGL